MPFFECPRGYGADTVEEYIMRCLGFVQEDVCQVSGWGYSREADLQDKPRGIGLVKRLEGFASSSLEQSNRSWLFGWVIWAIVLEFLWHLEFCVILDYIELNHLFNCIIFNIYIRYIRSYYTYIRLYYIKL